LVRFAGRWLTFSEGDSQRLFDALLDGGIASARVTAGVLVGLMSSRGLNSPVL
jgi:hypothetical protein